MPGWSSRLHDEHEAGGAGSKGLTPRRAAGPGTLPTVICPGQPSEPAVLGQGEQTNLRAGLHPCSGN